MTSDNYGTSQEYRFEIYAYGEDGQLLKHIDTTGGWLMLDIDQLSESCGKRVSALRLREYLRPPERNR